MTTEPTQQDCDNCFGAERYHKCKYFTTDNRCLKQEHENPSGCG